jgi:hypothetical protein
MENQFEKMTKQQLINLLNIYGRLSLVLDGFWFLAVEEKFGQKTAIDLDIQVWKNYGSREAKWLKKFFQLSEPNLEEAGSILLITPFSCAFGGEIKIEGDEVTFFVKDCLSQKARVRKGLGEFPCKSVGVGYFDEFIKELNPSLQIKCLFCPPDEHPDDLWCSWKIIKK